MTKAERALLVAVARTVAAIIEHAEIKEREYDQLVSALQAVVPKKRTRIPKDIRDQSWRRDVAILGGDPSL